VNVSSVPPDAEGQSSRSARHRDASSGREAEAAHLVELMTLSSRGHEDAFAELYDLTSQRIYGIVLRVLRSPDHAAEVTQEVYVEVWRQSARYSSDRGSVIAWMTTMAHRRAVDHPGRGSTVPETRAATPG
jgi:RNA polymerase sigma-70 factor (ECF subfamily)